MRVRAALLIAALALAAAPADAAPVGPPYRDVRVLEEVHEDATGNGTAAADATANAQTGALAVSATADETAPAGLPVPGTGVRVGMSDAKAQARVYHEVELPAATAPRVVTVTVQIAVASGSASASGTHTPVSGAQAAVDAIGLLELQSCAGIICETVHRAPQSQPVARSGIPVTANAVTFTWTVSVEQTNPLVLVVDAGLQAAVVVQGAGNAAASASGTVTSIDVAVA